MKRLFFLVSFICMPLLVAGSSRQLTESQIEAMGDSLKRNAAFTSVQTVLFNQQFNDAFINQRVLKDHNSDYTYEIEIGNISDQKRTGRCWMYAGLNVIRHRVKDRLNLKEFEFSENYLFFWDKLEKANHFLEEVIARSDLDIRSEAFQRILKSPMSDGGYWQNCVDLVKKYGCVPIDAMPEVASTANSRQMQTHLTFYLRDAAYKLKEEKQTGATIDQLRSLKEHQLQDVYRMLALHLGEPVTQFSFRHRDDDTKLTPYQTYTPQSFAKTFVEEDMADYVMFANWPDRDYEQYYEVELSSNLIDGTPLNFVNLPMEEIKKMVIESIKNQEPINFSADVGKQSSRKMGIFHADLYPYESVYSVPMKWEKRSDSVMQNISSTHAMVIIGVDMKDGKPLKWKVENSWGKDSGDKGVFHMYDNWMDLYVVRIVLHKEYVPQKYLKMFDQKPVIIPEYEPEQ